MYVWGVNSTVTKHLDYFVWKDTSERETRRFNDTVDKKRVNSCVLEYLCGGSWAPKKSPKYPGNALSNALLMSRFRISRLTPQKTKNCAPRSFWKSHFAQFYLIYQFELIRGFSEVVFFTGAGAQSSQEFIFSRRCKSRETPDLHGNVYFELHMQDVMEWQPRVAGSSTFTLTTSLVRPFTVFVFLCFIEPIPSDTTELLRTRGFLERVCLFFLSFFLCKHSTPLILPERQERIFDRCCFCCSIRNSSLALLEALSAQIEWCAVTGCSVEVPAQRHSQNGPWTHVIWGACVALLYLTDIGEQYHSLFFSFFFSFLGGWYPTLSRHSDEHPIKVGLGICRTKADSQWNPLYKAFDRILRCGNKTTCR